MAVCHMPDCTVWWWKMSESWPHNRSQLKRKKEKPMSVLIKQLMPACKHTPHTTHHTAHSTIIIYSSGNIYIYIVTLHMTDQKSKHGQPSCEYMILLPPSLLPLWPLHTWERQYNDTMLEYYAHIYFSTMYLTSRYM